jgi:hypothetical protein
MARTFACCDYVLGGMTTNSLNLSWCVPGYLARSHSKPADLERSCILDVMPHEPFNQSPIYGLSA